MKQKQQYSDLYDTAQYVKEKGGLLGGWPENSSSLRSLLHTVYLKRTDKISSFLQLVKTLNWQSKEIMHYSVRSWKVKYNLSVEVRNHIKLTELSLVDSCVCYNSTFARRYETVSEIEYSWTFLILHSDWKYLKTFSLKWRLYFFLFMTIIIYRKTFHNTFVMNNALLNMIILTYFKLKKI